MKPIISNWRLMAAIAAFSIAFGHGGNVSGEQPDRATQSAVLRAVARIDDLVASDLAKHDLTPNQPVSDAVFVRRTYLAITGMAPSYHQAKEFLESKDGNRRINLIDTLLKSEGYVNHFSNLWADTLRIHSKMGLGEYYRDFLKSALRTNKPYDELVTQLITAEGTIFTNGEVGFYLRDRGMPLDQMANMTQVFLGTRIQCAQCHDHPFDKWSQQDFYAMAAFTHSAKTEFPETKNTKEAIVDRFGKDLSQQERAAVVATIGSALKYSARRAVHDYDVDTELKLPEHEGAAISARPLFGPELTVRDDESPRVAFAHWVTAPDNQRFSAVIANRLWKAAMGRGLVEPIDDFSDHTTGSNPELLDYLKELMVEVNFDMKQFLRVVFNTRTFQREANRDEIPAGLDYHFPGPVMCRMSAEQVWDSVMVLMMEKPLQRHGAKQDYDTPCPDFPAWPEEDLFELAKAHPGITKGGRTFRRWLAENAEQLKIAPKPPKQKGKGNLPSDFFVSSQLEMPLKPGHFLRQFGQSDRMMIDGAHRDPTIPQVLSLLNGRVMDHLIAPKNEERSKGKVKQRSYLEQNIFSTDIANEKLDVIFISLLGRRPARAERELFHDEINHGNYADVAWVLLNSHEFLFVQ